MIKEREEESTVTTSVPVDVIAKFYWVQASADTSYFRLKISLYLMHGKQKVMDYHMAISYWTAVEEWRNSQAHDNNRERRHELYSMEELIKTQIIGYVTEPDLYTTICLNAAPELDVKMREFVDTLQITPNRADIHDIVGYDESTIAKVNKRLGGN